MNETGASSAAIGQEAEALARRFLEAKGFRVVATNKRTKGGELDLVAWDDEVLVFVEVKARANDSHGRPEEAVDRRKQERLVAAAGAFLAELAVPEPICRFDVVAVDLKKGGTEELGVRHFIDAFRPEA
jgi:putative endonuclease